MSVQFDLVGFTTTTTGTGTTIAVGAAIPDSGLRTLAGAGIADGTIVSYALVTGTGSGTQRETGTATVASSGTQLTGRTLVSSTTGSLISLTGTSTVMLGPNRADLGRDGIEMATARLLGRSTAGTGAVEEITLGTNLSFTGTTLNAAGGGGSPGGSDGQIQRNNAGAFAGSNISQDASGRITVAVGTQTTAGSALNLSLTANGAGQVINGLTIDATDTASSGLSRLADFRVNSSSCFLVTKAGTVEAYQFLSNVDGGQLFAGTKSGNGFFLSGDRAIWTGSGIGIGYASVILRATSANILDMYNGANGQTWNTYGRFDDSSNYRRISSGMSSAGAAFIRAEGAGTGSSGNTLTLGGSTVSVDAPLFYKQYTTATRPAFANGAVIFDSDLDKLLIGGASAWEVVTSA